MYKRQVLASVSKPDFNPNTVEEDWDALVNDSANSSLLNRATPVSYTHLIGEDAGTIEDVYEPYLIKNGFLLRTPRGRTVTELTYHHLGIDVYKRQLWDGACLQFCCLKCFNRLSHGLRIYILRK